MNGDVISAKTQMTSLRLALFSTVAVLALASNLKAGDWHGVVPLHSTRADVERLLGQPNAKYGRYDIGNELATIKYSSGNPGQCWDVPKDTVINITVSYHGTIRFPDLQLDPKNFERSPDPFTTSHVYYSDREKGIRYVVWEGATEDSGMILYVVYESSEKDLKLFRCGKSNSTQLGVPGNANDQTCVESRRRNSKAQLQATLH